MVFNVSGVVVQDAVDKGWMRQEVNGPPNLLAVVITAHEIACGLQHLHQQGVVHGDLSAFNIMLSTKGPAAQAGGRGFTAKVADFGEWGVAGYMLVNRKGSRW
jgi:serine/threonine protein kinase